MQVRCGVFAIALVAVCACELDTGPAGRTVTLDANWIQAGDAGRFDANLWDGSLTDRPGDASTSDDGSVRAARCSDFQSERRAFFGDLHVHTALSYDAYLRGTRARPVDAYRFARGERVGLPPYDGSGNPGRTLQLERPLDFAAVSDRAEFLGLVATCLTPGLAGYDSSACASFRSEPEPSLARLEAALAAEQGSASYAEPCSAENLFCRLAAGSLWNEIRQAAEGAQDASERCAFTSFVAYEWSGAPGGRSLHRNVIFHGDQLPDVPFSYFDGNQEEQLWEALERDCRQKPGCDVLAIPHSPNLSAGAMFEELAGDGRPFDRAYVERRARFEPLIEIFQHQGSSECMPELGADPLCAFEMLPFNTLSSAERGEPSDLLSAQDFVRQALGRGLVLARALGVNPFAYGLIAGTGTQLGTPGAVQERGFAGHGGAAASALGLVDRPWSNPGGLAVLWAEENSRASLFAALRRREVYATSGSRIELRLFGGFELPLGMCATPGFARQGYLHGVPMGGALGAPKQGARAGGPRFALRALRDPGSAESASAPLQRIQIIKGWLANDRVEFAIHDLAGTAEAASVDPLTCDVQAQAVNELCTVWSDESFDPAQPAFYYARVLEQPSCRWQARACLAAGVDCARPETVLAGYEACCAGYPAVQQERAWSSPIFYRPG